MNKQDYEKIKFESWIEFCKEHPIETPSMSIGEAFDFAFDRAYALGKQEKPAGPKFKVGQFAMFKGRKVEIIGYSDHSPQLYRVFVLTENYHTDAKESDLEPCTEPKETILQPFCQRLESAASTEPKENIAEIRNLSKDCDKPFDKILKDSFRNERRLNIATQIMSSILSNQKMLNNLGTGETTAEGVVKCIVDTTMMYTDALLAECNSPKN